MIYKYTKCESVIAKIMADSNMSEKDIRITDIREWIFEAMEKIVNGAKGILRRSDLNKALQQALGKKRATVDGYIRSWIADGIIKEDANKNVVLIANNITGNQQNLPLF